METVEGVGAAKELSGSWCLLEEDKNNSGMKSKTAKNPFSAP